MGHDAYDDAVNARYEPTTPDPIADCKKRAHAFIDRSENAQEVTLPGWLARKIAGYILYLEKTNGR